MNKIPISQWFISSSLCAFKKKKSLVVYLFIGVGPLSLHSFLGRAIWSILLVLTLLILRKLGRSSLARTLNQNQPHVTVVFLNRILTLWYWMCSSHRIPEAARCSLAEKNTAAGWTAVADQSSAGARPAADCTESYLSGIRVRDWLWVLLTYRLMGWNRLCTCLKTHFKNLKGISTYVPPS